MGAVRGARKTTTGASSLQQSLGTSSCDCMALGKLEGGTGAKLNAIAHQLEPALAAFLMLFLCT